MHYYVLKRKFANAYYTVRNERNIPSIMAFPYAKPAKTMLKTILSMEKHHHPLVVEQMDEEVLLCLCKKSMQPVLIFTQPITMELDVSYDKLAMKDAVFYLEHKFKYY